jgi:IS5 family transposase
MTSKLLTGEERVYTETAGYLGAAKREDAITQNNSGNRIRYKLNRRTSQIKEGSSRTQSPA